MLHILPSLVPEEKLELGSEVPKEELLDVFLANEGELNLYYGQIGSGKTYGATADIIEDLKRGEVVYATWPIRVSDFDDRRSPFLILMNTLLFRKRFYHIPSSENLHYINTETGEVDGVRCYDPSKPGEYIAFLNTLTHCKMYLDEAWRVIDSYTPVREFGIEVRNLILVTRHKFRTINLIAQRPSSIQVTARANVNRFYKFVKIARWPWVRFARYEFQEMSGESVNETAEPISVKTYFASKSVFDAYDTHFFGGGDPLHPVRFSAFDLNLREKIRAFLMLFKKKKKPHIDDIEVVQHELDAFVSRAINFPFSRSDLEKGEIKNE